MVGMLHDRYVRSYSQILSGYRFRTLSMLKKERSKRKFEARKKLRRPRSHSQIMTSALVKIDMISLNFIREEKLSI